MRERPLTIATYAAGASLAAITLVYVFGPTFFLDDEAANSSKSSRKKSVVGLVNLANDCFINSVLQALAGVPELRAYLIREVHRRKLDKNAIYSDLTAALAEEHKKQSSKRMPERQLLDLQRGTVTEGLKDVLDALNERPIYKKTVSAAPFIRVLEVAFRTRLSRSQQDAQEFLQIVVERLADEHKAGQRARKGAGKQRKDSTLNQDESGSTEADGGRSVEETDSSVITENPDPDELPANLTMLDAGLPPVQTSPGLSSDDESIFPMQGTIESQVECTFCHFKPKPSVSTFLTLTLNVPHDETSTSLDACFDGMFKVEHIDDFVCDKCRLEHALQSVNKQLAKPSLSDSERSGLQSNQTKIETALHNDPEDPPKDLKLPDLSTVPKRRITKHGRISSFPQILGVHLSRSVWDSHSISTKNQAKVSFPETLQLGGLLDRKTYRLLGVVTHKGGHNSGHYETFRRQVLSQPFSTPNSMGTEGVYSLRPSPVASTTASPHLGSTALKNSPISAPSQSALSATELHPLPNGVNDAAEPHTSSEFSQNGYMTLDRRKPEAVPLDAIPTPGLPEPPSAEIQRPAVKPAAAATKESKQSLLSPNRSLKRSPKSANDRWWRISDEKVKESKTSEVLGMQREVYLLFYELLSE